MGSKQSIGLQPVDCGENPNAHAFVRELHQSFKQAQKAVVGCADRYYRIGHLTIRVCLAGPAMEPLIGHAMEHLRCAEAALPDLTVCLWDSVSTGISAPSPPWTKDDYLARGEIRGFTGSRFYARFEFGSCTLNVLDLQSNLGMYWIRDARDLPYYESAAPFWVIFHWWLRGHGCQLIHAAAVGKPSGGVLLAGKGGSGKSTTALACLKSELDYVSDDYCVLSLQAEPFVHSIYCTAKLDQEAFRRFPSLDAIIANRNQIATEKLCLLLHESFPGKVISGFPVHALLIPKIIGTPSTSIRPASAAAGFTALAPSTLFQLAGAGSEASRSMAAFLRRVPCYYLDLGTELGEIPNVILKFLAKDD